MPCHAEPGPAEPRLALPCHVTSSRDFQSTPIFYIDN
jgi:hypothetical protein